jgi:hypothetical protein
MDQQPTILFIPSECRLIFGIPAVYQRYTSQKGIPRMIAACFLLICVFSRLSSAQTIAFETGNNTSGSAAFSPVSDSRAGVDCLGC